MSGRGATIIIRYVPDLEPTRQHRQRALRCPNSASAPGLRCPAISCSRRRLTPAPLVPRHETSNRESDLTVEVALHTPLSLLKQQLVEYFEEADPSDMVLVRLDLADDNNNVLLDDEWTTLRRLGLRDGSILFLSSLARVLTLREDGPRDEEQMSRTLSAPARMVRRAAAAAAAARAPVGGARGASAAGAPADGGDVQVRDEFRAQGLQLVTPCQPEHADHRCARCWWPWCWWWCWWCWWCC